MDTFLGVGNSIADYGLVFVVYGSLFIVMRFARPTLQPAYRKTFIILFFVYGFVGLVANYLLYLAGVMSFLPWLNNAAHTFLWIGLCLNFLFAGAHDRPLWEQFVFFFIFSFVVKLAEHQILGTWEQSTFFGLSGRAAYMLGWSLADGLIVPVGTALGLRMAAPYISGLLVPRLRLT